MYGGGDTDQDNSVTAHVTDKSGPMPGASVLVKGTVNGTVTDSDGNAVLYDVDPDANDLTVIKKLVFGVDVYAPAAVAELSPRYAVDPDAIELITLKNDVFGDELYAPTSICALSARYAVEPDADELIMWKNDVFGAVA